MTEAADITPADIEAKFRDIQGQIDVVAEDGKKKLVIVGGAVAVALLVIMYVFGQRTGRRKSTVLEIRRI